MFFEGCEETGKEEGRVAEDAENTGRRKIGQRKVAVKIPSFILYCFPRNLAVSSMQNKLYRLNRRSKQKTKKRKNTKIVTRRVSA